MRFRFEFNARIFRKILLSSFPLPFTREMNRGTTTFAPVMAWFLPNYSANKRNSTNNKK